jgi:hypothetical protein
VTVTTVRVEWLAKVRMQIATPADCWLAARICAWTVVLRLLKHVLPLSTLVRRVRLEPRDIGVRQPGREVQIITLARWTARATRWSAHGTCLEQALVTYRYLTRLNASPTLVIGVAPSSTPGQPTRGHAWVRVDGCAVDDTAESLDGLHEVVAFDSDGKVAGG